MDWFVSNLTTLNDLRIQSRTEVHRRVDSVPASCAREAIDHDKRLPVFFIPFEQVRDSSSN
jgi:hypothetical protein